MQPEEAVLQMLFLFVELRGLLFGECAWSRDIRRRMPPTESVPLEVRLHVARFPVCASRDSIGEIIAVHCVDYRASPEMEQYEDLRERVVMCCDSGIKSGSGTILAN